MRGTPKTKQKRLAPKVKMYMHQYNLK